MTQDQKDWIDNASYEQLLRKHRFGAIGDPIFQSEAGNYYLNSMRDKKSQLSGIEQVAISKRIGWDS